MASSSIGGRQPAALQRVEPAEDRGGGGERELLPDHLQHERSPQVARQSVEEAVGVEPRLRLHQRRHPGIRRAQQLARPPSDRRRPRCRRCGRSTGPLPDDLVRALVVAQPEEARLAQPTVVRPLGEADLGDQLGPGPVRAPWDRSSVDERRCRLLEPTEARRGRGASPRCSPSRPCRRSAACRPRGSRRAARRNPCGCPQDRCSRRSRTPAPTRT